MKKLNLVEKHIAEKPINPTRLQEYGVGIFETKPTKSGFKKALKNNLVFVDGKVATTALFINGGETIELFQHDENKKDFNLDLEVLFEDDFLAIINKPAGINVSGNSFATIANALSKNLKFSSQKDAVRPHPVHRLDYPTSGLLLIGKTTTSIIALNKMFEHKKIQKTYHAICIGKMPKNGEIDFFIDDKHAFTQYNVLQTVISKRFEFLNLVQFHPKTGRKHQLRKHLLAIGNPILGDKDYFLNGLILKGKGLYLHASSLNFKHPITNKTITITGKLPHKFEKISNYYKN